ncbi:MAG TPA: TIGR03013 family XrtA/PEP-CTERM system glycosyltransferase [Terriglobales bacterium]|nr:TIGR03013 family XrtA/PEP-CTERM system glycosyltransferase [Terriglobales bacterium]
MIRVLNVYYPIRKLILLVGEALIVLGSLLLGAWLAHPDDFYIVMNYDGGIPKILGATALVLLCSHWFDLYDTALANTKGEMYFRLLLVPALLSFGLAAVSYFRPEDNLLRNGSSEFGLLILTTGLIGWRIGFGWLVQLPILVERIYVLGTGDRALRLVQGLRQNPELGVEVASWTGKMEGAVTRDSVAAHLMEVVNHQRVHRVIVAMPDRRGTIPMRELLDLRMHGVKIEEATSWLEKMSGKIEVESLNPSWLIFADGFRRGSVFIVVRRALSIIISLFGLIASAPLWPLVMLLVKLDSPGPTFYSQQRVGKYGKTFNVIKFRTMRQDAEAASGPQWAGKNDPRITRVGRFLRSSRLDEIPQLWCVLKGDMAFVGPRPERPEFVEMLTRDIPFYGVRHMVRPGLTGWAQIRYKYGSTVQDAIEKLQYDLFYIKNASIGLDLLIMFQTIKTVLLRRGAQ